ncbi:helix-turn-helix domain-containing protein [Marinicella rhabdoformis]|uniref:helix-turn-helix domain-containing protein n=1 Tax=Marinicella rhabdoformis TaxID=2580566 RepID=UPI0012AEDB6B|nr:AraC family transcriptional regulator [Marinicella rhabdoformis]
MDSRISNTLNYIEAHLADDLKLKDLAHVACLSVERFHQLFKSHTGLTPFKFIEQLRLNFAYQQLVSHPQNIQTLSEQCGYKDYETFSRAFKKKHDLAPDDLAQIVQQIKTDSQADQVHVTTVDAIHIEKLQHQLSLLLDQLKPSHEQLSEGQVYIVENIKDLPAGVENKELINTSSKPFIKNKFMVSEHPKLWHSLIQPQLTREQHDD